MSKTITRPTAVETTLGTTFAIKEAPTTTVGAVQVSVRSLPTITWSVKSAASLNAETVTLAHDQSSSVYLDAGTVLSFGGAKKLTVATGISIPTGTTGTAVDTLPIPAALTTTDTATAKEIYFVNGCTNATVSPEIKNEETTNYLSGVGMEQTTVGNSKKMNLEFNLVYNDKGSDVLRKISYDATYVGREFYFELTFASGEKHSGFALLTSASPQGGVQQIRKFQCEAQIQGDSYVYTPPTAVTP